MPCPGQPGKQSAAGLALALPRWPRVCGRNQATMASPWDLLLMKAENSSLQMLHAGSTHLLWLWRNGGHLPGELLSRYVPKNELRSA